MTVAVGNDQIRFQRANGLNLVGTRADRLLVSDGRELQEECAWYRYRRQCRQD